MFRKTFVLTLSAVAALAALALSAGPAGAFEAADNDAFFLGFGSANVEVQDSTDLLSGANFGGGVRIGLFWTFFVELGYGTVGYVDSATVAGVDQDINFRTTGANYGLGLILPIRNVRLGGKYLRNPNNRWAEEITDRLTGTTISRKSGTIDYDTYTAFVQFGETGVFEAGVRRDLIRSTDSAVTNSFGPYLAFNISLK